MKQLNDIRWAETIAHLEACCMHSRMWSEMVQRYIKVYGDVYGSHTSGTYNPRWPDHIKDRMRDMAHAVSYHDDLAHAMKPKGAHRSTVNALARFIAKRDGSGFYGPQG